MASKQTIFPAPPLDGLQNLQRNIFCRELRLLLPEGWKMTIIEMKMEIRSTACG